LRLAISGGNAPTTLRRPGWRTGLERGLDRDHDELCGLRVDDDVPAEQHAADDLPGMRERVLRADGGEAGTGGIGYRCHPKNSPRRLPCLMITPGTVEETVLVRLLDTPGFATPFTTIIGQRQPVRAPPVIVSSTV
jgi:hypothetical protein